MVNSKGSNPKVEITVALGEWQVSSEAFEAKLTHVYVEWTELIYFTQGRVHLSFTSVSPLLDTLSNAQEMLSKRLLHHLLSKVFHILAPFPNFYCT